MSRFLVSRAIQAIITLVILSILVFILARLAGDPVVLMVGIDAPLETMERVRQNLGLDRPYPVQYALFVWNALMGDFGRSLRSKELVTTLIASKFLATLELATVAGAIALALSIPLGILSAIKRGTFYDGLIRSMAVSGMAAPLFWTGLVLMQIFSVQLGLLPISGKETPLHYVLPCFTLGFYIAGGLTRLVRSSMIEVLGTDYVRLARAKGLRESKVIGVHALRNALIPVVSFFGVYSAVLLSGSVVTETVFNWPGLGRLAFDAVMFRDYPVVQGLVLFLAVFVVVINMGIDVLYSFLDPRIKYA